MAGPPEPPPPPEARRELASIAAEEGGHAGPAEGPDLPVDVKAEKNPRPWYGHLVLMTSVLLVCSGGAVMKSMGKAAPISRAGWRMQVSSAFLLPCFLWQLRSAGPEIRSRFLSVGTLAVLLGSATCVALHFALWVYSLDATSLPHSLLFVSCEPLVLALLAWLRGARLSRGEVGGTALGFCGAAVIAAGHVSHAHGERQVSAVGDLAAFLACVAFVAYLSAGQHLREWIPIYLFMLPIVACAALQLGAVGVLVEGWVETEAGQVAGPLGWTRREFLWPNLYLGVGPGFLGHTGLVEVLKYMDPLVIGMAITVEPLIGSAMGWLIGVDGPPGLWTCVGGGVLIAATLWVNYAGEMRRKEEEAGTGKVRAAELVSLQGLESAESSPPPLKLVTKMGDLEQETATQTMHSEDEQPLLSRPAEGL